MKGDRRFDHYSVLSW